MVLVPVSFLILLMISRLSSRLIRFSIDAASRPARMDQFNRIGSNRKIEREFAFKIQKDSEGRGGGGEGGKGSPVDQIR